LEYVFLNGSDATNGFVGPATGTYQVKQDCTGLETLTYPNGFEIDRAFVLSNGGRTIHILTTKIHTPFLPPEASAGVDCLPRRARARARGHQLGEPVDRHL
jgi:hypothetical protein